MAISKGNLTEQQRRLRLRSEILTLRVKAQDTRDQINQKRAQLGTRKSKGGK